MTDSTDDYLTIHSLNDLLYCERRCALHRVEQVWVDNAHTVSGVQGHQRADKAGSETGPGVRVVHAVLLKSDRLRLTGKADIVEFHRQPDGTEVPFPVEYKRGRRRKWDNDEVQLCAQALCLEEMLDVRVPAGAIYHIKSRRRREVTFTAELRAMTETTTRRLHELVALGVTPPPVWKPRCQGCSLLELCMPRLLAAPRSVSEYQRKLFSWDLVTEP